MRIMDIAQEKMASSVDFRKGSHRTAMERFGDGGMALLPWTKHVLTVLWEQLRVLVHVIYYSFLAGNLMQQRPQCLFCMCGKCDPGQTANLCFVTVQQTQFVNPAVLSLVTYIGGLRFRTRTECTSDVTK